MLELMQSTVCELCKSPMLDLYLWWTEILLMKKSPYQSNAAMLKAEGQIIERLKAIGLRRPD